MKAISKTVLPGTILLQSVLFGTSYLAAAQVEWAARKAQQERGAVLGLVKTSSFASFENANSGVSNGKYVFLAGADGAFYAFASDQSTNYPFLQRVRIFSGPPIAGIAADTDHVYVADVLGNLSIFSATPPFLFQSIVATQPYGVPLSGIAVIDGTVYVSKGQGALAVTRSYLYFAQAHEGDVVLEFATDGREPSAVFGSTFEPGKTVVYSRLTGQKVTAVANPPASVAAGTMPVLYADDAYLAQIAPDGGIFLYGAIPSTPIEQLAVAEASSVIRTDGSLIVAAKDGTIRVFDITRNPARPLAQLDLGTATGHDAPGDIQITGVTGVGDRKQFTIFAWSNWANPSPDTPSFFVVRYAR